MDENAVMAIRSCHKPVDSSMASKRNAFVSTYHVATRVSEPYLRSRPHQHPTWELSLYTSGVGEAHIGERRVPLSPGAIVCYPPDIAHHEIATVACAGYFFQCHGAPWPAGSVPTARDTPDGVIVGLMALMHVQSLLPSACGRMQAWHDLLLAHLVDLVRVPTPAHPVVEELQRRLGARFREPAFTVGAAMRGLPLAKDHLRRRFVAATGMTPQRWLSELRIAEARNLLAFGHSVVATAAAAGFADPYYFSRAYLKLTGERPSVHRRR